LTSLFPICVPFISSSHFIVLASNSKTMLNASGESGHPCLVPEYQSYFVLICFMSAEIMKI
jgi:hypothetical protein